MKKILVFAIILCAGGAAAYVLRNHQKGAGQNGGQDRIVPVERGMIRLAVASTGRVMSNLDVEIKCKASGQIVNLPYDISDSVTTGTLLVELDPVDEDRNVKRAEVGLSSSKARLAQSRLNLETAERQNVNDQNRAEADLRSAEAAYADAKAKAQRMKQLLESESASQEEYETAETAATRAAVQLDNAKIRLKEIEVEQKALDVRRQDILLAQAQEESDIIALEIARQRLKETKVYAPISGVMAARNIQIGQIISSSITNVGGGTALLTLSDLSRLFVMASVDESDIGSVELGQDVIISADAFPGRAFRGKVERIATKGSAVSNVVTFETKIEVVGEGKEKLKPEMTANVEIIISEKQDALLVPTEAVTREGRQRVVQLAAAEGTEGEKREVKTGIDDGFRTEVLSGLAEGEKIVITEAAIQSRWARQQGQMDGRRMGGPGGPGGMMMRGMSRGRR